MIISCEGKRNYMEIHEIGNAIESGFSNGEIIKELSKANYTVQEIRLAFKIKPVKPEYEVNAKIVKFNMLIEDLNRSLVTKGITESTSDLLIVAGTRPLNLFFDYRGLNDYAKIILSEAIIMMDDKWSEKYIVEDLRDRNVKLQATKDFITLLRSKYGRDEAIKFIFWSVFITIVDKTNFEENISLVSDLAIMMNLDESVLEDIILIVKYLLDADKDEVCGKPLKDRGVREVFDNTLSIECVMHNILGKAF